VTAVKQECGRCCQLAAEAEKWFMRYLRHLAERAKGERGAVFSVVVMRAARSIHVCRAEPKLVKRGAPCAFNNNN